MVEIVDASGEMRDVPGRRLQTLLARLVSQPGQIVSVDALIDAVWPDGLPDSPDAALQTQVFRLRKRLRFPGAPTVATSLALCARAGLGDRRRDRIRTRCSSRIGAEPSVARPLLHDALSLWRGAPYAGFEDVEALRAEQVRLDEFHLQAIEAHAEALLACGEPNRAITELDVVPCRSTPRAPTRAGDLDARPRRHRARCRGAACGSRLTATTWSKSWGWSPHHDSDDWKRRSCAVTWDRSPSRLPGLADARAAAVHRRLGVEARMLDRREDRSRLG